MRTQNDGHGFSFKVKGNAVLQASLERRKEALHKHRLALEQDVSARFDILFLTVLFFPLLCFRIKAQLDSLNFRKKVL